MRTLTLSLTLLVTSALSAQWTVPLQSPRTVQAPVRAAVSDGAKFYAFGGEAFNRFGQLGTSSQSSRVLAWGATTLTSLAMAGGVIAGMDAYGVVHGLSTEGELLWTQAEGGAMIVSQGDDFLIVAGAGGGPEGVIVRLALLSPQGKSLHAEQLIANMRPWDLGASRTRNGTVVLAWVAPDGIHTAEVTNGRVLRSSAIAPAPGAAAHVVLTEDLLLVQAATPGAMRLFAARMAADGSLASELAPVTDFVPTDGRAPLAVRAGGRDLVVWRDWTSVYALDVDPRDLHVGVPASAPSSVAPVVAASASEILFVNSTSGGVIAPTGTPAGPLLATPARPLLDRPAIAQAPSVAWSGEHYVAAWQEETGPSAYGIATRRFTHDGTMLDAQSTTVASAGMQPSIAASRELTLVCWMQANVRCARVTANGRVLDTTPIDAGVPGKYSPAHVPVATDGRDFLVAFSDERGQLHARLVSAGGSVRDAAIPAVYPNVLNVAFDGRNWIVQYAGIESYLAPSGYVAFRYWWFYFAIDRAAVAGPIQAIPYSETSSAVLAAHDGEVFMANGSNVLLLRNGSVVADHPLPFLSLDPALAIWNGRAWVVSEFFDFVFFSETGEREAALPLWRIEGMASPGDGSWCAVTAPYNGNDQSVAAMIFGPKRRAADRTGE